MNWKDFLYFHRGEQVAVTLLLVLILLAILLNITICSRNVSDIALLNNDSLTVQFDEFRESLQEREIPVVQRETEREENHPTPRSGHRTVSEQRTFPERPVVENRTTTRRTSFPRAERLAAGETISLNETDTTKWMKIPGIGSTFANRIVRYQNRLGGFASVNQLLEVNGMSYELFERIVPYITPDTIVQKLKINLLEFNELLRHPYLEFHQVQVIMNLRRRTGTISSINQLAMLYEFSDEDIERLRDYLAF
jgi:hypothetical protein